MAEDKPRTKRYTLRYPVEFGTDTITEITLRRPKGKDMERLRDGAIPSMADTLDLIGQLSGQPKAVVREFDADDVEEVARIIQGFRGSGRPTGDEPAPS